MVGDGLCATGRAGVPFRWAGGCSVAGACTPAACSCCTCAGGAVLAFAPAASPSAPPPRIPAAVMAPARTLTNRFDLLVFMRFSPFLCFLVLCRETLTDSAVQRLSSRVTGQWKGG